MIYMAETRKQGREMLGARVPRLIKLQAENRDTNGSQEKQQVSRPVTPALHNLD